MRPRDHPQVLRNSPNENASTASDRQARLVREAKASGEPAPALPHLERSLKVAENTKPDVILIAGVKFELAQALDAMNGYRVRALALGREALEVYRTTNGREEDLASIEAFVTELQK